MSATPPAAARTAAAARNPASLALWTLAAVFALLGARRVAHQLAHLLWGTAAFSAGDLLARQREVQAWFAGIPVYATFPAADYPPATYAALWPAIGWLSPLAARAAWAILCCLSLGALSWIALRATQPATAGARALAVALPWGLWPSALSIAVGQLGLPCLAAALGGATMLRRPPSLWRDAAMALCCVGALVKPSLTVPLVALVAASPRGLRPALLTGGAYGALTLFAVAWQPAPRAHLALAWVENGLAFAADGYGNAAGWLARHGARQATLVVAALLLAGFLAWAGRRSADELWRSLALAAVVARVWTYHNLLDDVLILAPMIFLLGRLRSGPAAAPLPWFAFLLCCAAMLAPTSLRLLGDSEHLFRLLQMSAYTGAALVALLPPAWTSATPHRAMPRAA